MLLQLALCILLYRNQSQQDLLCGPGSYTQYVIITYKRKGSEEGIDTQPVCDRITLLCAPN